MFNYQNYGLIEGLPTGTTPPPSTVVPLQLFRRGQTLMATRALQQVLTYIAWNTSTNAYETGDVANHTLSWVKDGTRAAPTNAASAAEIDATNLPGRYKCTMTSTETDCIEGLLDGKSSTANVVLIGAPVSFDYLNTSAPATAGIPDVNVKNMNNVAATSITTINANQGTTQPVNFTGTSTTALVKSDTVDIAGAAVSTSTAQIGVNVVTNADKTGYALAAGQKVDVDTIKTNPVVNAGTVTFPTGATLASTTNITAGTITTTTNLTNLPAIPTNWLTATGIAASALNGKGDWLLSSGYTAPPTVAQVAAGVWRDTVAGDFTVAASIGKSVMNGVALGTGLTINAYTGDTPQTGDAYARIGAAGAGLTAITGVTLAASQPGVTIPTVTTVTTTTNLTNAPTAGDLTATMKTSVENAVWNATMASHLTAGTTGLALNSAGSAGDPWNTAIPGAYGAGTAGHRLGNIPDVAAGAAGGVFIAGSNAATTVNITGNVSGSVGSVTGGVTVTTNNDKAGYALTSLPAIPANWLTAAGINAGALNGKGDWLLSSGYTAPSTAAQVATAVWQDATAGDFTTTNSIGKSLYNAFTPGTSEYTAAALALAPTGGGSGLTGPQVASAVWDEPIASHATAGSAGASLASASSAGDPWRTQAWKQSGYSCRRSKWVVYRRHECHHQGGFHRGWHGIWIGGRLHHHWWRVCWRQRTLY
jgi:hypothetical protein